MEASDTKNIILAKYSLVLSADGQVKSQVDNVDPKQVSDMSRDWPDAPIFAKAIAFIILRLEQMDADLEKYLQSL